MKSAGALRKDSRFRFNDFAKSLIADSFSEFSLGLLQGSGESFVPRSNPHLRRP